MKKLVSTFLFLGLLVSFINISVFAIDSSILNDNNNGDVSTYEERMICDANADENFEADSVIVVLKNAKSRELKSYTEEDFSEISAVSVKNLTGRTMLKIQEQRNRKNNHKCNIISNTDELKVNENKFHQILQVQLPKNSKDNVLECIKVLENRDDVLSASPNYIYTLDAVPNDPDYNDDIQWSIDKIKLPDAWNIETGSNTVKVGIIDTGIDGTHPELLSRIDTTLSKDFTSENAPLIDGYKHGTHVAGIIGAQSNNSCAMTGVCWDISLVSLKIYAYNANTNKYETSNALLADAIDYAISFNIPILNCSNGGSIEDDLVYNAINQYEGLFVCSAGNNGLNISNTNRYPSCYDCENIISVAATDKYDALVTNSNYSVEFVDLAAPGAGIYSTYSGGIYAKMTGTSVAAPHVAGVAALLKSKYPAMNATGLKYYILNGVDKLEDKLGGKVSTSGRLNAYKSLSSVKQYTVRYNANGGTGTMADTTVIYANPTPIRANQFTNGSATFMYWHAKRESDNKWYYTNGTNKGWYLEGQQPAGYYKFHSTDQITVSRNTTINNDVITMYAQWRVIYNIEFNGNSGTGTMQSMQVQQGVSTELNSNAFVKNRFVFDHWYAKNEDGDTYYIGVNGAYSWCTPNEKPSGYSRKVFSDTDYIHTLYGVADGDAVTLYAYWEPNFGVLGDADSSGSVTVKDATDIQKYAAGLATLTADQILLADVDYSGVANVTDATIIQKYLAGTSDYFEY